MNICFRTNLDVVEEWQWKHNFPPNVGDRIESKSGLWLEVCGRCFYNSGRIEIELHLPKHRWNSIREFNEWYERSHCRKGMYEPD